jgi:UPF0716 family protein affecting phage T7 exclusion
MDSDLSKAWMIVRKRTSWVGSTGTLRRNIADAVAEGIALGRKEGVQLVVRCRRKIAPGREPPAPIAHHREPRWGY